MPRDMRELPSARLAGRHRVYVYETETNSATAIDLL
jgi:hypothetical protein